MVRGYIGDFWLTGHTAWSAVPSGSVNPPHLPIAVVILWAVFKSFSKPASPTSSYVYTYVIVMTFYF